MSIIAGMLLNQDKVWRKIQNWMSLRLLLLLLLLLNKDRTLNVTLHSHKIDIVQSWLLFLERVHTFIESGADWLDRLVLFYLATLGDQACINNLGLVNIENLTLNSHLLRQ